MPNYNKNNKKLCESSGFIKENINASYTQIGTIVRVISIKYFSVKKMSIIV